MRITSEVAHSILIKLKKLVNYNINIMNSKGVIVGSTDSSRLNQIHQGALMVFDTKKAIFIYSEDEAHFPGARPGVNLPIEIQNKIIGCIGVTGEPDDVIQFAQILKVTVEVMLQEMELFNQLQYENKLVEKWVIDFVHPTEFQASRLEEDGIHYLNLDFQKEVNIFLIRFNDLTQDIQHLGMEEIVNIRKKKDERIHQLRALIPNVLFSSFLEDDSCIMAIPTSNTGSHAVAKKIHSYFSSQDVLCKIGIGGNYQRVEGYRKSFLEARDSLQLLHKFPGKQDFAHVSEWGMITLFQQVPEETLKNFYLSYLPKEIHLNEEQIHTLETLYNHALNMKATAEELHIHRNTLLYRLDSISKKTGLDPKNFHDALLLRLLLVIEKLIT